MKVERVNSMEKKCLHHVPWRMLKRILMTNYEGREQTISDFISCTDSNNDGTASNAKDGQNELDELFEVTKNEKCDEAPNPLDIFLVTFLCCDLNLKQVLTQKMFMCRLAVPYIYPQLGVNEPKIFSFWGLHSIVVECIKDSQPLETSLVEYPSEIVSFVKFGCPYFSKSILMNNLLNGMKHNTFSNRDCCRGCAKSKLCNGMIEASWYMPSGKEGQHCFEDITTFLNLRGDASTCIDAMSILSKVSNSVVVCVDSCLLGDDNFLTTITNIHSQNTDIILLILAKYPHENEIMQLKSATEKIMQLCEGIKVCLGFQGNEAKGVKEISEDVQKKLHNNHSECQRTTLMQAASMAKDNNIDTDEDECLHTARQIAENVLKPLEQDPHIMKGEILPLQSDWKEWSCLQREMKRCKDSQDKNDKRKCKMQNLREKQKKTSGGPLMNAFTDALTRNKDERTLYFVLKWLALYFDNISRQKLPHLQRKYHEMWHAEMKTGDNSSHKLLMKEDMENASLGLEHLMRELGQLYEVHVDQLDYLPCIIAQFILAGHPLEIMDGDTINVPLKWISAVLTQVRQLIGNKKIFVLSVLGIQSSGKSTLLNTMFGTQFAMSAGRCTKGVNAQLLPVKENEFPFDYVMLLDTEGLRAPELLGSDVYLQHDNEIATLVVGLGDATLVNIKGENVTEMQDILQITVHAFLRMKLVNERIDFNRTCIFVHQNVPAMNAKDKMAHGCRKLVENLNRITKEAATLENVKHISTFSDILKFDSLKHVWYFSELFEGDPPMSPVNPGYSYKTLEVKSYLFEQESKEHTSLHTIDHFITRMGDLWSAILAEDFVFSFRNSLEARAYHELEQKQNELSKGIDSSCIKWLEKVAKLKINTCQNMDAIDHCVECQAKDLNKMARGMLHSKRKELESYINGHSEKGIIIQWQAGKLSSLESTYEKNHLKHVNQLQSYVNKHKVKLVITNGTKTIEDKAKRDAEAKFRGKGPKNFDDGFESCWRETIHDLNLPTSYIDIEETVETVLHQNCSAKSRHLLTEELDNFPLNKPVQTTDFDNMEQIGSTKHKSVKKKTWFTSRKPNTPSHVPTVHHAIIHEVQTFLANREIEGENIEKDHIQTIIEMVQRKTGKDFSEKEFTVFLVFVFRKIMEPMARINDKYMKTHSSEAQLGYYKIRAKKLYISTVEQREDEMVFVEYLFDTMESFLMKSVSENRMLVDDIVRETLEEFSHSKATLMRRVMEDLIEKEDFEEIMAYVQTPSTYALNWLEGYVIDTLFTKDLQQLTKYSKFCKKYVKLTVEKMDNSIRKASTSSSVQEWVATFCSEMSMLESDFQSVTKYNIPDFIHLQGHMKDRMDHLQEKSMEIVHKTTAENVCWNGQAPHKIISETVWGCQEMCPFCMEPCMWGNHEGKDHQCIQHKPSGMCGSGDIESRLLSNSVCNFKVNGKGRFSCGAGDYQCKTNGKCDGNKPLEEWHKYKEYRTVMPDWDIAPDPAMESSDYWQWIMAKYKDELATFYDCKAPEIPESWYKISKKQTKESLKKLFT